MPRYYPLHVYYPLIPILVRCFCAISFLFLSGYYLRENRVRKARWGGNAYVAFVVTYAILYLDLLAEEVLVFDRAVEALDDPVCLR